MLTTYTSRAAPCACRHPNRELPKRAESLALFCRAMDPDHLLHHAITREETKPRLKSRRPFATSGKDLMSTTLPKETKAHQKARMWSAEWQSSTSGLREYITSPSKSCLGSDLPQQTWVKLNTLRTGVGASMLICGDGAYPRVQPAVQTAVQTSRQRTTGGGGGQKRLVSRPGVTIWWPIYISRGFSARPLNVK